MCACVKGSAEMPLLGYFQTNYFIDAYKLLLKGEQSEPLGQWPGNLVAVHDVNPLLLP